MQIQSIITQYTDGRTNRQTDRQTDIGVAVPRFALSASRGKNFNMNINVR